MRFRPIVAALLSLLALVAPAAAIDDTEKELERYRQMLKADPWSNPGLLDADRGEALFFRRQGPMDFACATCHGDAGKRIRLQGLPYLSKPEEARAVVGEWPAYRVSQGTVMTPQHRIADCYWQMRLPLVDYGSDVTIALTMYLVNQAKGGDITAPAIKR